MQAQELHNPEDQVTPKYPDLWFGFRNTLECETTVGYRTLSNQNRKFTIKIMQWSLNSQKIIDESFHESKSIYVYFYVR